ncbi:MAG: hypothetical protein P1P60_00190 [Treponema phagedenis]|uniref:DUF6675 family protein n=1 Tax=Treponema phagedenis TaxID=162 RepID=UPI003133F841
MNGNRPMIKKYVCIIYVCCAAFAVFSQSLFNDNLTVQEREKLEAGQILIRNIGKAKKISLNPVTEQAEDLINRIKKLKPAYLAEIIQIRPESGNEHLIDGIKPLLLDVQGYVGIPYWSERQQQFYDLYSSAEIVQSNMTGSGGSMNVDLDMMPFGAVNVDIELSDTGTAVFYGMKNTGNLKYDNITVIRSGRMQSFVYVFKYNGSIILYGIGGVNAPSVFFLRDRIETSLINRIKTFCTYIFEKID